MFSIIRTSNLKIKEVISLSDFATINSFKNRFASVLSKYADRESSNSKMITAVEPHYCYVITSGLHGDTANDNGDFFRWSELLKRNDNNQYTYETWIDKPVLENHNMDHKRGIIVDAFAIKKEKSIDFLLRIDEKINPNLVKGIRNGSITGTSMGVMVGHSYCSVCNNLAYDESNWCVHLSPSKLNLKGRLYTGQDGNLYPKKVGQLVWEDNRSLFGVEDSIISLGEPADQKARTKSVLV